MKKLLISLAFVLIISGCADNMAIKQGDMVSLEYTGTLSDGSVFDSNKGGQALTFTAGAGQMIAGFDAAVIGMGIGDEKTFSLPPSQAYGEVSQELIQQIKVSELAKTIGQEPQMGMVLMTPQGHSGRITSLENDFATIDFNHELAGKELTFSIKIIDVKKSQ